MSRYGAGDDNAIVDEYLDAHLCGGIKQGNLDKILDLIDEYVECYESLSGVFTTGKDDRWIWELPIIK